MAPQPPAKRSVAHFADADDDDAVVAAAAGPELELDPEQGEELAAEPAQIELQLPSQFCLLCPQNPVLTVQVPWF